MSSVFFSFYFPHSSDDDFEEVEFGSGSEPEVVIQDSKERILMFFVFLLIPVETLQMYRGLYLPFRNKGSTHTIGSHCRHLTSNCRNLFVFPKKRSLLS